MLTGTGMRRLLPFSPQKSLAESTFPYQNPTRFNTLDLSQQANDFFFFFLVASNTTKILQKATFYLLPQVPRYPPQGLHNLKAFPRQPSATWGPYLPPGNLLSSVS